MFEMEDEIEAEGERLRKLIVEGMSAKGLTAYKIGEGLGDLAQHGESEEVRLGALKEAIDMLAARPSRVQKKREISEQRLLSVKLDGTRMLGVDPARLRRLSEPDRLKVIEAQKLLEGDSNGGA